MIPENAIRSIEFTKEDIESCNTVHFVNLFQEISQTPWKSKELKGKVVLGFSVYNDDPRPNYGISEIRKFVQSIDSSLPYFPYFLFSEPAWSQILFYLQCLIEVDPTDSKYTFSPNELISVVRTKMIDINRFCEQIADDSDSIVEVMILGLPPEILTSSFPEYAMKALNAMGELLKSLLEVKLGKQQINLPPEMKAEYMLAFENATYTQAEKLSGIQRTNYPSEIDFLTAILNKIAAQANI